MTDGAGEGPAWLLSIGRTLSSIVPVTCSPSWVSIKWRGPEPHVGASQIGFGANIRATLAICALRVYLAVMTKAQRQRLINAIYFFASKTKFAGQTKLLKLLYLLDFEHFKQTGRSVTGLDYEAWSMGPVPRDFRDEWKCGFSDDLARLVNVREEPTSQEIRQTVVPNEGAQFDDSEFTPRQLGLMSELVARYRDAYAKDMVSVTHAQNGAWDKVWRGGQGRNKMIPYELALPDDCEDRDEILQSSSEYRGFLNSLTDSVP